MLRCLLTLTLFAVLALLPAAAAIAQPLTSGSKQGAKRSSVALEPVKPTAALVERLRQENPKALAQLNQACSQLDAAYTAYLSKAGGLQLKSRTSLAGQLDDADLQDALGATPAGDTAALVAADFRIVTEVSYFEDIEEKMMGEGNVVLGERRQFRMDVIMRIEDLADGSIEKGFDPVRFEENEARLVDPNVRSRGDFTGRANAELVDRIALTLGNMVVDYFFPAKVIARTGPQVTISRGAPDGVEVGQVWEIFAPGEKLFDPETGTFMDAAEEILIGKIEITAARERFSSGKVLEDFGIAVPEDIQNNTDKIQTARRAPESADGSKP